MVLTVKDFVASTGFRVRMLAASGRSGVARFRILCDVCAVCTLLISACLAGSGQPGFVGDHVQGVTPVPIPNTEVKPLQPMILLSGKVGYRRLYGPRQVS